MLQYALLFLVIAVVAGLLGFGGIAGAASGIAQVLFFQGDEPCDVSYADRKGKYQKQQTILLPHI